MCPVSTVRTRAWEHGEVVRDDFPLEEISELRGRPDTLFWVDLCDVDGSVLDKLAAELDLSPLAVEDATSQGERVKLARHPGHLFITCYAASVDTSESAVSHRSRLVAHKVSVFVLHQGLVTVRHGTAFDMTAVTERWDDNADLLSHGVFALLHGLLDEVVDSHFDAAQDLDDAIEEIEGRLFENQPFAGLQEGIYRLRREVLELRRVVLPMREIVMSLIRRGQSDGDEHHGPPAMTGSILDAWYDDLYDHALRAGEWLESLRDMVGGLFETNLSLQDARLNTIMKKLAGWAAIIAVPTAITGWFGQNVPIPGDGQPWGVLLSVALILVSGVGLYAVFRKHDWI